MKQPRLVKKFRFRTLNGRVVEVDWVPEGLLVTIDGNPSDTRAGAAPLCFEEIAPP